MDYDFLESVGGRPSPLMQGALAGGDPEDGATYEWNFGIAPSTPESVQMVAATPSLHERFPNLGGRWDGKSTINHHDAVRKVLGKNIPAQLQPRGTCGGRAGSRAAEILQCVLIANGKRAKFHYVSHAAIYYGARKLYGMLRGISMLSDGVAGGSVPEWMSKGGTNTRDEVGDTSFAGSGSDDLAVSLGGGRNSDLAAKIEALAKDNLVTAKVRAKSAQECADGLAAGGVICQSDSQGFQSDRDEEGVCRPRGTWHHYQVRSGVRVTPKGRKIFVYDQSWGENNPQGPLLPGCPGNCFGVEWDVQDEICRKGEVDILFGFDLWDLETGAYDLDWKF